VAEFLKPPPEAAGTTFGTPAIDHERPRLG
jgi:hypothetical protein